MSERVRTFAAAFAAAETNDARAKALDAAMEGATVEDFVHIHVEALRLTAGRANALEAQLAEEKKAAGALARKVSLQSALLQNMQCY